MKEKIFALSSALLTCLLYVSCSENEHGTYSGESAVYFSETSADDSLQYSFASGLKTEDVVKIPVRIIGASTGTARSIAFGVDAASTAVEGVHYKALPPQVTLPAGQVETSIDVTVLDGDPKLETEVVELILRLNANEDFVPGFPEKCSARLLITKQLVKPSYWDFPLSLYYGSYSRTKHRLCIQMQGFDFPDKFDTDMVGQYISYGRMVYNELLREPRWDEETQTWIKADWIPL